eukprot:COSAG05_NODE_9834_length_598_cov_1.126253_1_plen_56_part_10
MAEDEEDLEERVEFVYNAMDKNKTGVSYMLFLRCDLDGSGPYETVDTAVAQQLVQS